MVLPAGHSPTGNRRGTHPVTVLALLLVALAPHVGAFVPAGGGNLAVSKTASAASSCVKRTRSSQPWGTADTRHDHEQSALSGGPRGNTRRRSTPNDATVGDGGEGAGRDGEGVGGVESKDIWAGAELPLSNNQQVEQATGALWKVNIGTSSPKHVETCTRYPGYPGCYCKPYQVLGRPRLVSVSSRTRS